MGIVRRKAAANGKDEYTVSRHPSLLAPDIEISLYRYENAPAWLQNNKNIHTGYRGYLDYKGSLHSLFVPHNETINIWSHLIGFVYFFCAMIWTIQGAIQGELPYTTSDVFIVCLFLLCAQASMFFSATFHLFNCCSPQDFSFWLSLDFLGIAIGTVGCYFPGVYYAFNCFETLQIVYTGTIMALTALLIGAQFHPNFGSEEWSLRRTLLFGSVMLFGIIPACHWVLLHGFYSHDVQEFLPELGWLYGSLGAGFFFYISWLPERLLPGKLDILGHSHQWWHVLMLAGLIGWHRTIQVCTGL